MPQGTPHRVRFLSLLILLIAVFTAAQVYKWVDDDGQVHFGDRPPEEQTIEEIELPQGPSAQETEQAKEEFRKTLESRQVRDESLQKEKSHREIEKTLKLVKEKQSSRICVRATQQARILKAKVRIFKLNADWSRSYLENEKRPLEISSLNEQASEHCKTDAESRRQQYTAALVLGKALNIKCVNAREKLASENLAPARQAEYQQYLQSNCPEIDPRGFWIADWIHHR